MQIVSACTAILHQLTDVVDQLDERDFSTPSAALGNATIGQHLRHTLEFFICLQQGFERGTINYDKREHDEIMETDKFVAIGVLSRIKSFINTPHGNPPLKLEVAYRRDTEESVTCDTNYLRELIYNIEHAVHHMAIMKIGIREVAP
ncbi:MAG TPA: DinB family protein, partial [Cyclobacteriaceae bacterium]|nr:DinB family protein [Cyclobacteriaceae bacterium]